MEPSRGAATAGGFELSGGRLCLDFANTWGDRSRPEGDRLRGYDDLLAFAEGRPVLGRPVSVRTTRQMIDLLRQLAIVAPLRATRRAAASAAEAAFREALAMPKAVIDRAKEVIRKPS